MSEHQKPQSSSAEIFGSDRMWGLKELALPEPVNWWPQTAGWYYLLAIFLIVIAWYIWKLWKKYQFNAYRRQGLAQLEAISDNPAALSELPFLLRKAALHAAQRKQVAGLRGKEWIAWLNESAGQKLFEESDAQLLDRLAFSQQQDFDSEANSTTTATTNATTRPTGHLIRASKSWMRSHRATV
ncbi:MAG: DUF4381 domain-containing protein [Hyphomicrobiales bacterium]|nr:DUF4381 domain-containing protein [Hyphomicrobiales bacterium]